MGKPVVPDKQVSQVQVAKSILLDGLQRLDGSQAT